MHVKFRIGFVWKDRGPQELSQEEQKQLHQGGCLQPLGSEKSSWNSVKNRTENTSKGFVDNPLKLRELRGPLRILSAGQGGLHFGLRTFHRWYSGWQQALSGSIAILEILDPWLVDFCNAKIKVHLFNIALWVNCGTTVFGRNRIPKSIFGSY